jgi:hypothetical protein
MTPAQLIYYLLEYFTLQNTKQKWIKLCTKFTTTSAVCVVLSATVKYV